MSVNFSSKSQRTSSQGKNVSVPRMKGENTCCGEARAAGFAFEGFDAVIRVQVIYCKTVSRCGEKPKIERVLFRLWFVVKVAKQPGIGHANRASFFRLLWLAVTIASDATFVLISEDCRGLISSTRG